MTRVRITTSGRGMGIDKVFEDIKTSIKSWELRALILAATRRGETVVITPEPEPTQAGKELQEGKEF